MRPIYLFVEKNNFIRKVMIDMAFLSSNKKLRLAKYLYEDGLYLLYPDKNNNSTLNKFYLTRDNIIKEDENFYYIKFPFSVKEISKISN